MNQNVLKIMGYPTVHKFRLHRLQLFPGLCYNGCSCLSKLRLTIHKNNLLLKY